MATVNPAAFSDRDLLIETERAAARERHATAALLALLAEVDTRRLYLGEGFSSLFQFATRRLRLSEPAAYGRITAARAARRFPVMLPLVDEGALSLTTISLLAPHLNDDNLSSLLEAARFKSKREVELIVAALHPQPDIRASIRMLPAVRRPAVITPAAVVPRVSKSPAPSLLNPAATPFPAAIDAGSVTSSSAATATTTPTAVRRSDVVAPLGRRRYLIRMTVSEDTQRKFMRVRDLLRHVIPDGDPAAIVDRALTLLLAQLEQSKSGAVARPRTPARLQDPAGKRSRRVPAAVRRAVWARDQGRCAFIGASGRCEETGALEFHHVVPFASGGATTVQNIQLRCRSHNEYEGALAFGDWRRKAQARAGERRDSVRPELSSHSADSTISST